ncbi:16S rRNA (guanine(966)-N(2))-methyltransferase RsmD [Sulfobacillus harzensis]|uniref:16S rRNA (Guanine(966)-N(2))-methyltransferase RsmD n=1 Tax=Sulfobacillus harzensis TaxID=2729629 RepID=A0A7Y0L461_9FIRM|nr:16S rRNA (guanine(966)-N(2))-methyltransferase RsmD [Sulfobacillus harzensis]NMP22992.1 16S rRNA (guanine(966)-N(2))-methyltransferase RsmD [Sulfobacillus harzensis]
MRIIGGIASGRRLVAPKGAKTRPTGDWVREALFNIWQPRVRGSRFLDGYAGTGAVGLEALSRGAQEAVFCEVSRTARQVLEKNVALVGLPGAEVWPGSLEQALQSLSGKGRRFDLIFCDPPWDAGLSLAVRENLHLVLDPDGMLVVESRQSDPSVEVEGLTIVWTRRYGDTRITAYQASET